MNHLITFLSDSAYDFMRITDINGTYDFMNSSTRELIQDAAPFLLHFDRTHREYLKSPLQAAILIIEAIESGNETIEDIAATVEIHPSTVTETIRALRAGGYPIAVREAGTQGCKYLVSIDPNPK